MLQAPKLCEAPAFVIRGATAMVGAQTVALMEDCAAQHVVVKHLALIETCVRMRRPKSYRPRLSEVYRDGGPKKGASPQDCWIFETAPGTELEKHVHLASRSQIFSADPSHGVEGSSTARSGQF